MITGGAEAAYRREVEERAAWYQNNNVSLNPYKTEEMIIDPRRCSTHRFTLVRLRWKG